jgi:hypothetical protein
VVEGEHPKTIGERKSGIVQFNLLSILSRRKTVL